MSTHSVGKTKRIILAHIAIKLQMLRQQIENGQEGSMSDEQTLLLSDICGAIGLSQEQEANVLGENGMAVSYGPVPYEPKLEPAP